MEELYCFPYGREFVGAGVRPEARYYGLACVRRTYVRTSYVRANRQQRYAHRGAVVNGALAPALLNQLH